MSLVRYVGQFIGTYGPGSGPILLDDVHCAGNETHFTQCRHAGWASHDCSHAEDVAISCTDDVTVAGAGHLGM